MTKRAEVVFRVREYENGRPWILIEEVSGDLKIGVLGFDLHERMTLLEAKEVEDFLNERVTHFSLT